MPLVATRSNAGAFGLGWSAAGAGEELGGMVLLTPTSISYSGTSASIGANGSVEFSAITSLSLNGVFSADYDNYMVSLRSVSSTSFSSFAARLRASGTDNSTASSYTFQILAADGTSVTGSRGSNDFFNGFHVSSSTARSGDTYYFWGPHLSQPTAVRQVSSVGYLSALIYDHAWTHNQSTAYDGFTIYSSSPNMSGLVSVYGLVGA